MDASTSSAQAYKAGCSVGTIRKIESDERRPSRQLAAILAQFLDIPPDQVGAFTAFTRSEPYIDEVTFPTLFAEAGKSVPITDLTYQPASSSAARTLKHNLALDTTPFLGREQEMADLDEMWTNPDCRLVTIAGPGGIGKTQLAQAYAAQLIASAPPPPQPRFPDSVYFVDLAAIRERSQQIDLATMAAQLLADL